MYVHFVQATLQKTTYGDKSIYRHLPLWQNRFTAWQLSRCLASSVRCKEGRKQILEYLQLKGPMVFCTYSKEKKRNVKDFPVVAAIH